MKNNKDIPSIVSAIVFLIVGALLFTNPNMVIAIISYTIGIVLILIGIYSCIKNYYNTKQNSNTPITELTFGIIMMIIGIVFLLLANSIGVALQYVFGAFMLFSGINNLINALQLNKDDKNFIVQIIVASLLILGGLYTILKSNLAFEIVGIVMMIYATLEIVSFITNRNSINKHGNNEVIKDAKVIEDKTDTKKIKKDK